MKKIRRWLLAFAVIIALMVRVDGLKATSLIFGRSPTSTTTTTTSSITSTTTSTTAAPPAHAAGSAAAHHHRTSEDASDEQESSDDQGDDGVTKPPLTGIPQIDYVWDPNLPRELRGANLSSYPFLDSVPVEEEIGFTCDPKLHDGFYASIKYNCQLYHHCVNGVRYDFLCANYTAFDQKTFICHFASEVDCKNSPKYWFRNEPLYKATTTTTQKPAPTTSTAAPPTTARPKPLRPTVRRRRPQVDYYYDDEEYDDEYYEERPRRRKNRPRNRRPTYEEDYEYDDRRDRYRERERERDRDRDVEEDDYDDRRTYRPKNRNRNNDRRNGDDDRRYSGYDDRRRDRDRRPVDEDRRRPIDDDRRMSYEDEKRSPPSERRRRPMNDERKMPERERRPMNDDRRSFSDDRKRPVDDRNGGRRPYNDERRFDYDDEEEDYVPRRPEKRPRPDPDVVTVKPSGSTIYDRPRAAPRINRPVPLNEKDKYSYSSPDPAKKKLTTTPVPVPLNEPEPEYYDEYEDEPKKPEPVVVDKRKVPDNMNKERTGFPDDKRQSASSDVVYYDDIIVPKESLPQKQVPGNVKKPEGVERINSRDNSELSNRYNEKIRTPQRVSKPVYDEPPARSKPEYVNDQPEDKSKQRTTPKPTTNIYNMFKAKKQPQTPVPVENKKQPASQNNRDYDSGNKAVEAVRPVVRVTKRPFLPSRGGNPYAARGLQPVGIAKPTKNPPQSAQQQQSQRSQQAESDRPAPFRIDVDNSPPSSFQQDSRTSTTRPTDNRVKTLDQLYDEEFDVTLNDALNPTLKPLTRSAPQPNYFRNRFVPQGSSIDSEFVPFEPNYAPSEFRRAAVRPPAALVPYQPTVYVSQVRGHHPRQRYEYEYEY